MSPSRQVTALLLAGSQLALARPTPPSAPWPPPGRGPRLLAPARFVQGQAFIARLEGGGPARPDAIFGSERVRMTRAGREWVAVIGIPLETRPGGYTLRIVITPGAHSAIAAQPVAVERGRYPQQHLTMPGRVAQLYTAPGANEERRIVNRAIRGAEATPLWSALFIVPTAGRHSTEFGAYRVRNGRVSYRHRGIDIAAPEGQGVVAANDGVVRIARHFQLFGNAVVLDHGAGVTTLYLHMSALAAREGQRVRRGALIGRVGATGAATGPHLHWSIYAHSISVDPLQWTRDAALARPG